MVNVGVKIYDEVVRAKLAAAAPRILAQNRLLVTAMLREIEGIVHAETPSGPGHFGYHGRDTLKIEVKSRGIHTTGQLRAAVQLYWREYGTGGRYRGPTKRARLRQMVGMMTGQIGTGGERAYLIAHKALSLTRRLIKAYYGGMAAWWRS